jgi:hypothetical protein
MEFKQEGISLWKQLRLELAADYEVFYQNEGQLFRHPKEITKKYTVQKITVRVSSPSPLAQLQPSSANPSHPNPAKKKPQK